MAYKHITAGSAISISGACSRVLVTVNTALTGTITVSDETGTTGSPVVAVITNPTVGSMYEYWDLKQGVCITPSATCDITVSTTGQYGSK
jgi:hypothetical protein